MLTGNNAISFRRRSREKTAFFLCVFSLSLFVPFLFAFTVHAESSPPLVPPLVFQDENGVEHALSDYRGRYVILNVWAKWCAACIEEMPSLNALQAAFDPRKVLVLPLSEDHGDSVVTFYRSHALSHLPVALDTSGHAPALLRVRGLPTTLVVDKTGHEIARFLGSMDWSSPEIVDFLKEKLR